MNGRNAVATVRLSGAPNFRDAGGYSAAAGLHIRSGLLFRSGELSRLTVEDVEVLRGLCIRLVVDLRSESERKQRPSRLPDTDIELFSVAPPAAVGREGSHRALRDILALDATAATAQRMMLASYRQLPSQCAPVMGRLIHSLAAGRLPVLIHCTAGKDRTGFVCACLHHLLGVPRSVIDADYLRSGEIFRSGLPSDREAMLAATSEAIQETLGLTVSREVLKVIGSVELDYLEAGFSALHQEFGSVERYAEHCGAHATVVHRMRERMLE